MFRFVILAASPVDSDERREENVDVNEMQLNQTLIIYLGLRLPKLRMYC